MRYRISEIKIGPQAYADQDHLRDHLQRALETVLRQKFRRQIRRFETQAAAPGQERGRRKMPGKGSRRDPASPAAELTGGIEIIRESIDARHKPRVQAVYTLDFDCPVRLPLPEGGPAGYNSRFFGRGNVDDGNKYYVDNWKEQGPTAEEGARPAGEGSRPSGEGRWPAGEGTRPVIAGFGPCGIFAALTLAEAGLRPIVLERGQRVSRRIEDVRRFWEEGILDPESNVQFGEGGAGTFSDGKLTTGIRDPRIRRVLEVFVEAGADPRILYQQRPHIGTDRLRQIIPRIRERICDLGGEIRFGTRLTGLEIADAGGGRTGSPAEASAGGGSGPTPGVKADDTRERPEARGRQLRGLYIEGPGGREFLPANQLILAIGHSARDTLQMLADLQLPMEQKPFSIGVRIQHPQQMIDQAQYGDPALADIFGPAVYKLHHRCKNGRGVYTFCMCPGGEVINGSSEAGRAVTNGMSLSGRDSGTANSGLLVDVRTSDFGSEDPLAGVAFQRVYEELAWQAGREFPGGLPRTTYGSFRDGPDETGGESPGRTGGSASRDPVRRCLPAFAAEAICEAMPHLGAKLAGFDREDGVMTAVETRSSSPVRIRRDETLQTEIRGLIPAGEGPGYAGGIMSAAVDGIRAAEAILKQIKNGE